MVDRVPQRKPPPEPSSLEAYAASRGLTWSWDMRSMPYGCVLGQEDGDNFNVIRGRVGGGGFGLLAHRVLHEVFNPSDGRAYVTHEPMTMASTFAPETKATLMAATYSDALADPDYEHFLISSRSGITSGSLVSGSYWRVVTVPAKRFDISASDALWAGPIGEWVRGFPGAMVDVRAGIVSFMRPGHITDEATLDHLADSVVWLASTLREHCLPYTTRVPFDAALPEPSAWGDPSRKAPDDLAEAVSKARPRMSITAGGTEMLDPGSQDEKAFRGVRDFAHGYASKRGLVLEDPRTFDKSFPSLPFGGWAQIVWRGALRDGRPYRLVVERAAPVHVRPRRHLRSRRRDHLGGRSRQSCALGRGPTQLHRSRQWCPRHLATVLGSQGRPLTPRRRRCPPMTKSTPLSRRRPS